MFTKKTVMVSIHCEILNFKSLTKFPNKAERIQERVASQKRTKL